MEDAVKSSIALSRAIPARQYIRRSEQPIDVFDSLLVYFSCGIKKSQQRHCQPRCRGIHDFFFCVRCYNNAPVARHTRGWCSYDRALNRQTVICTPCLFRMKPKVLSLRAGGPSYYSRTTIVDPGLCPGRLLSTYWVDESVFFSRRRYSTKTRRQIQQHSTYK